MAAAIWQRKFFYLRKAMVWPWRRSCKSSSSKSRKWPHCAPRWDKGTTSPTRSSVGSRKMRRRDEKSKADKPCLESERKIWKPTTNFDCYLLHFGDISHDFAKKLETYKKAQSVVNNAQNRELGNYQSGSLDPLFLPNPQFSQWTIVDQKSRWYCECPPT